MSKKKTDGEDKPERGMRYWLVDENGDPQVTEHRLQFGWMVAVLPMAQRLMAVHAIHTATISDVEKDRPHLTFVGEMLGYDVVIDTNIRGLSGKYGRDMRFALFIGPDGEKNAYDWVNTVLGGPDPTLEELL